MSIVFTALYIYKDLLVVKNVLRTLMSYVEQRMAKLPVSCVLLSRSRTCLTTQTEFFHGSTVRYILQSETAIIEVVCGDVTMRGVLQNKSSAIRSSLTNQSIKANVEFSNCRFTHVFWLCPNPLVSGTNQNG